MDTRVWGPSAWKMLHAVAMDYNSNKKSNIIIYKNFFVNLQNILPCKYCRMSYSEFIIDSPFTDKVLLNNETLSHNLFVIHNKVNNKLIKQGYPCRKKSRFTTFYNSMKKKMLEYESNHQIDIGYTFIGCVVFNFPISNPTELITKSYKKFLKALPKIYPTSMGRKQLKKYLKENRIDEYLTSRSKLISWFTKSPFLKYTIKHPNGKVHVSKKEIIDHFESFRANCSTETCRNRSFISDISKM